MYPNQFHRSVAPMNINLKAILKKNSGRYIYNYSLMVKERLLHLQSFKDVSKKLHYVLQRGEVYQRICKTLKDKPKSFKDQSACLLRVWGHQCECVLAQRLRRSQQMFSMYSKLWEEHALKEFIKTMGQRITRRSRDFLLGAVGLASYDWQKNRISDADIKSHINELEYIKTLKDNTICSACPRKTDRKSSCNCNIKEKGAPKTFENWATFIQRQDLIVWRRMHQSGHWEYKVYGNYSDVTAIDFLNVQIDTKYRRTWDPTAVVLEVGETDSTPGSNSDIVYWEMQWPKLFVNRDYVFNRRFLVDKPSNTILIVSKSTHHPSYPSYPDKHRVEDYWSYMVVKPYKDIHKPGIEFSLTYYDNPGVSIPQSVTTWVAMRAMPDFLERLREASKKYRDYCKSKGVDGICKLEQPAQPRTCQEEEEFIKFVGFDDFLDSMSFTETTQRFRRRKPPSDGGSGKRPEPVNKMEPNCSAGPEGTVTQATSIQSESKSWWRFFRLHCYF